MNLNGKNLPPELYLALAIQAGPAARRGARPALAACSGASSSHNAGLVITGYTWAIRAIHPDLGRRPRRLIPPQHAALKQLAS
jgi:hypothetical protein